ncbi:hypothetical protein ACS73_08080 [Pseudomonas lini]|nr:hypothetical protein ACS73_08080 [Pseudomonas lini]
MVLPLAKRGERHFTGWLAVRQFGWGFVGAVPASSRASPLPHLISSVHTINVGAGLLAKAA